MLGHLAVDDERFWFRGVAAGEPAADTVLAGLDLDAAPARWPDSFADWRLRLPRD